MPLLLLKRCLHLQLFVQNLSVGVWQSGMLLCFFLAVQLLLVMYIVEGLLVFIVPCYLMHTVSFGFP